MEFEEAEDFDGIDYGLTKEMNKFIIGETETIPEVDDLLQLEQYVMAIVKLTEKQDFLKQLKKKRVEIIDQAIEDAKNRENKIREISIDVLNKLEKKTVDYPGLAKITKTNKQGKWIINDEESLLKFLKEKEQLEALTVIKYNVKKRELDKFLDGCPTIPECVEKEKPSMSLTVTLHNMEKTKEESVETVTTDNVF